MHLFRFLLALLVGKVLADVSTVNVIIQILFSVNSNLTLNTFR